MKRTVFWSWQSDLIPEITKNFIKTALMQALKKVEDDLQLEMADRFELDHDTKGEAGLVEIATTIFNKIDECEVFVADITPIAISQSNGETKKIPNPNVMIELGYALRGLGHQRVITVANLEFGGRPEELPFDLRHRRGAITYKLSKDEAPATRDKINKELVTQLSAALKLNLETPRDDKTYKNLRPSLSLRFIDNMPKVFLIRQNIALEQIPSLDEIKAATPLRNKIEQQNAYSSINLSHRLQIGPMGFGKRQKHFRDWTTEELEGYNNQVKYYYEEYKRYIEKTREHNLLLQRTFNVTLEIVNSGTLPANDIRSSLTFPSGIFVHETNNLPVPPLKPNPPPFVPNGFVSQLEHANLLDSLFPKNKRIADDHTSINFNFQKIPHGFSTKFHEFTVIFDSPDDINDFEANYYISADELPQTFEGKLLFRVELKNSTI